MEVYVFDRGVPRGFMAHDVGSSAGFVLTEMGPKEEVSKRAAYVLTEIAMETDLFLKKSAPEIAKLEARRASKQDLVK
jgi:hypothetical protein